MKPILQLLPNLLRLIALLLLLLLPVTDATTMPDNSDDDTAFPSKSWANDTSGVSLLENLEDANLSDKVTGAKLWIVARRKIIRKLQVTHNLWDFLVDFASRTGQGSFPVSNRVKLIEFEGLGGLCHAGRSAGIKQPEV
jgi:hypothetical protein